MSSPPSNIYKYLIYTRIPKMHIAPLAIKRETTCGNPLT